MSNTTNIYFRELGPAYVNVGGYEYVTKVKKDFVPIQGAYQAGVNPIIRDLPETNAVNGVYTGADSANYPLMTPEEIAAHPSKFLDQGAEVHGTISQRREYTSVPKFRAVVLLYMYKQDGSNNLVQFDSKTYTALKKETDPSAEEYLQSLVGKVFTDEEYFALCGAKGFTMYGNPLPKGLSYSNVSELSYVAGNFVSDEEGVKVPDDVPVYVTPMWLNNGYPMFSSVYFEMDSLSILGNDYNATRFNKEVWNGIPDRLLRWQGGGIKNPTIAPINRDGFAVTVFPAVKTSTIAVNRVTYYNSDDISGFGSMPHS